MESNRKIPSLLELCIQSAIDNLRYIGDVGWTEIHLLEEILPHCTCDQLMHIENSTEGRDLSPATDKLWKRFYEQHFGEESANQVIRRMRQNQVVFKWRKLYEAKLKEREQAQEKTSKRLRQRYAEEEDKKRSRQTQLCSKVPPPSRKRSFCGGNGSSSNFSNLKSNLLKKAKMECLNSHEAKIHATMKKNALHRQNFPSRSAPRFTKPSKFLGNGSASGSKLAKPLARG